MRITTKGRYALRALIRLINDTDNSPISIRQLSEIACLSPEFLEQIFFRLRKADIIKSTRGPGGGFSFVKEPSEVSVDDIFIAIDEGYHIAPCSDEDEAVVCEHAEDCYLCGFWQHTHMLIRKYFAEISLQDLVDGKYPKALASPSEKEAVLEPYREA
ncbi:MAG: Rrf2 family transcriptional regulator [Spirochaetales bacterium]|nr:Rrf2 family transcriptional regulator [Spirochaetales bacterium]